MLCRPSHAELPILGRATVSKFARPRCLGPLLFSISTFDTIAAHQAGTTLAASLLPAIRKISGCLPFGEVGSASEVQCMPLSCLYAYSSQKPSMLETIAESGDWNTSVHSHALTHCVLDNIAPRQSEHSSWVFVLPFHSPHQSRHAVYGQPFRPNAVPAHPSSSGIGPPDCQHRSLWFGECPAGCRHRSPSASTPAAARGGGWPHPTALPLPNTKSQATRPC